jgi:hypothetical protein
MSNRWLTLLIGIVFALSLAACASPQPTEPETIPAPPTVQENIEEQAEGNAAEPEPQEPISEETEMDKQLHLMIDGTEVSVAWEDNASVDALTDLVDANPLTVGMSMYGGFEQVGSIGTSLPRNDKQTTTESGDIVLYSGNQIVIFYGSNSWSYTRLGRITDKTAAEMTELLGSGDVTVTVSYS